MKTLITFVLALMHCWFADASAQTATPEKLLYQDTQQPLETRVEDLLARLTPEEKIALLHAVTTFSAAPIPRLGVPARWLSDGPHGVRQEIGPHGWNSAGRADDFATAFPCGIALAATWNPALAQREGEAIAEEALARGKDIMLSPAVNIMRTPLNGRNFEYFGEDPYLAARMAVGFIEGMQARGVAACVKHFAVNNQETQRNSVNVEVDERVLREIYLPAFEAAVKEANVWTLMSAYNRFRGEFCTENDYLLNQILKDEWGFKGIVISDWGASHTTAGSARGGLDLEMGTIVNANTNYNNYNLASSFLRGVQGGEYPMALLDDKARRNLRVLIATGALDGRPAGSINTRAHQDVSRQVAEESMVLLKNDGGALPLDIAQIKSIAVIGENAVRPQAPGGQSSEIKALYEITPLQGILARVGNQVNVTYSAGYLPPAGGRRGGNRGGSRRGAPAANSGELIERAVAAAKQADVAIIIAGLNKEFDTESRDKPDMALPYGQDELIARVVEANPRTIVVLALGSPVAMGPWLEKTPAALVSWYGGSEGGNALARLLFGDASPSGKLPCTFPKQLGDSPAHSFGPETFPGQNGTETYTEGMLVGYRWFDAKNIEPLFPFGHGLSYTTFTYSNLRVAPDGDGALATVLFDVTNSGARVGAEVAQLYVRDPQASVPRPEKELKGFRKITLQPGETQTVTLPLDQRSFAFYDAAKKTWVAEAGEYQLLAGGSSRSLPLSGNFNLGASR